MTVPCHQAGRLDGKKASPVCPYGRIDDLSNTVMRNEFQRGILDMTIVVTAL
jgi:hypothetical protein